MTCRERKEAKAQRLREWAGKREQKAEAAFNSSSALADQIPLGQPILTGHHSQAHATRDQDRIMRQMDKVVEHIDKASEMSQRAENIERQVDIAIYSDDPDAAERLKERIANLEAKRDRIKAYNSSCRRAVKDGRTLGDTSLLEADERRDLEREFSYGQPRPGGAFTPHALAGVSAEIRRNRERLEGLAA